MELYREIHLKRSLSKTAELIFTKFGSWCLYRMGLSCVQFKGLVPFGAQKEGTIVEILGIIFLSQTNGPNAFIFGMKRYLGTSRFKFV